MNWMFVGQVLAGLFLALSGPFTTIGFHRKARGQDLLAWAIAVTVSPVCAALGLYLVALWLPSLPPPHQPLVAVPFLGLMFIGFGGMWCSMQYYKELLQRGRANSTSQQQIG